MVNKLNKKRWNFKSLLSGSDIQEIGKEMFNRDIFVYARDGMPCTIYLTGGI